jgi:hypothetical protein
MTNVTIDVIEDVIENKLKPALLAALANGAPVSVSVEAGTDASVKDGIVVHARNSGLRFVFEIDPEKLRTGWRNEPLVSPDLSCEDDE